MPFIYTTDKISFKETYEYYQPALLGMTLYMVRFLLPQWHILQPASKGLLELYQHFVDDHDLAWTANTKKLILYSVKKNKDAEHFSIHYH